MARKIPQAAPAKSKTPKATAGVSAIAERTVESTGSTVRLLLEPLPDQHVRILEYHRLRRGEARYHRQKDEEGQVMPFRLLNLEQSFEELFPQGELIAAAN